VSPVAPLPSDGRFFGCVGVRMRDETTAREVHRWLPASSGTDANVAGYFRQYRAAPAARVPWAPLT
jgi:hypothetical protein